MKDRLKKYIKIEIEALSSIPLDGEIEKAVDLIYEAVHQNGGKVIVSGMGKAGNIGVAISTTLASTGTPAVFLHPGEAQHGDLGILQKHDILFLISNSGLTREIIELECLAKQIYPDIKAIILTKNPENIKNCNTELVIPTGKTIEICTLGLTPTVSTTVMSVIGDLIVVLLSDKIKLTKKEYAKRHHQGYLGKKASE